MGFSCVGKLALAGLLVAPVGFAGCKKNNPVKAVPQEPMLLYDSFAAKKIKDEMILRFNAKDNSAKDKAIKEIFHSVGDPNDEAMLVQSNFLLSDIFAHVLPDRTEVPNKENTLEPVIAKWINHSRKNAHLEDKIMKLFKVHYERAVDRNPELARNIGRTIAEISRQQ